MPSAIPPLDRSRELSLSLLVVVVVVLLGGRRGVRGPQVGWP
ncbi:MAG TPA: hypothetical protein VKS82_04885 [Streptosporangiaceae bacterium]|nr:hypothetical protein [Streptosporangiaceae bacterium]